MKRDIHTYLEDISTSIRYIVQYIQDSDFKEFQTDTELQDAVLRRLTIIGEAAKRIPDDFKDSHPNILWKQITGMRDVLIHDYADVNLKRVWDTITQDLALLREQLEVVLSDQ